MPAVTGPGTSRLDRFDVRRAGWLLRALRAFVDTRDDADALKAVRAIEAEDPEAPRLTLATRLALRRLAGLSLRPGAVLLRPALRDALLVQSADPASLEVIGLLSAQWDVLADIALLHGNRSGPEERLLELLTVMALGLGELELARELDHAHLVQLIEPVDPAPLARRVERALEKDGRLAPGSLLAGRSLAWIEARAFASLAAHWYEQAAIEEEGVQMLLDLSQREKADLFEVLAEVAWADGRIAPEERRLVESLLDLARLPEPLAKKVRGWLEEPPDGTISGHRRLDKSTRRFVLEQAILLALVDEEQHQGEVAALQQIARRLGGTNEELEEVLVEVAAFCEANKDLVHSTGPVSGALGRLQRLVRDRVEEAVRKNAARIATEIKETGELAVLLAAAGVRTLTPDESRRVKAQLLDVAKTIPALAIFALPGGGLLLPILIKVLPFNVLPTAFSDEPGASA